jgi:hypothetical protein
MKPFWLIACLLWSAALQADSCALSSARFGREVLAVGDPERAVLEQRPDRRVTLQNRFGAVVGVRYEFHQSRKTVEIVVRRGRVTRICHVAR